MNAIAATILLHHYMMDTDYCTLSSNTSQSVKGAYRYLKDNSLLDSSNVITERGQVLVKHWLACPFPVASWEMP